jgi:hypothetical protein
MWDIFLCRWQGFPIATHIIFRHPPGRARLLFSGTVDRNEQRFRSVVGPCNRLLHWHELQHYKLQGYRFYDFGGCVLEKSSPEYPVGQFKSSFGGQIVLEPTIFLSKSRSVRALLRSVGVGQSAVRSIAWPQAWKQAVRARPRLAQLFR